MQAVQYVKSVPRYLAVKALSRRVPRLAVSRAGVVRLADIAEPTLPGPQWVRLRTRLSGICGSDLSTITAEGSPYFSRLLSYPFVLGHEVVATVESVGSEVEGVAIGTRVVVEPALHCAVRGVAAPCASCRAGRYAACENVAKGDIAAGIQTGYCRDTGGGWSPLLVAHRRQLVPVPDDMSDEAAVLTEPLACSMHAALRACPGRDATVLVLGCGTIGLLTIAALRALGFANRVIASAKYPHQMDLAKRLGADHATATGTALYETVAELTGAEAYPPEIGKTVLIGGVDVTLDCVGAAATIDDAARLTRSGGTVVLVGMPAIPRGVDWTSIWHKELTVRGSYAYGVEHHGGEAVSTFSLAMAHLHAEGAPLAALVDARYPLVRYREAILHALHAGRRGSTKTVFQFPAAQ
jgi:threonine dehydrogenase-like Zn-dependent dehydrogenase